VTSAQHSLDRNSTFIGQSVADYLDHAPEAASHFESLVSVGFTKFNDLRSLRDGLASVLLQSDDISEATFTFAKRGGFDAKGSPVIDPATVGQVTLFRARKEPGFVHRITWYSDRRFVSIRSHLYLNGRETRAEPPVSAPNPASHLTFITPASRGFDGNLLWTDLHWSGLDEALPETGRRVAVSALELAKKQPFDPPSVFLAARCRAFLAEAPVGWQGVYTFESK
jgi:adenylate cyclase